MPMENKKGLVQTRIQVISFGTSMVATYWAFPKDWTLGYTFYVHSKRLNEVSTVEPAFLSWENWGSEKQTLPKVPEPGRGGVWI